MDFGYGIAGAAPNGIYGAQFWRNGSPGSFEDVPEDAYFANGYQGQSIVIVPSKNLVVVRVGYSVNEDFDFNALISGVIEAVE